MNVYMMLDDQAKDSLGRTWTPGIQQAAPGLASRFTPDWFVAYSGPLLAAFVYPAFENIPAPHMYIAKASGKVVSDGVRTFATKVTIGEEIDLPKITLGHRQIFAANISVLFYKEPKYINWVNELINNGMYLDEALELYLQLPSLMYPYSKFAQMTLASIWGPSVKVISGDVEKLTIDSAKPLCNREELNVYGAACAIPAVLETQNRIRLADHCKIALQCLPVDN